MAPRVAAAFAEQIVALGHELAGVMTQRNVRSPERFVAVVDSLPYDVDVVVPGSRDRIAPLLRSFDADLAVCNGFGMRIPADALATPRLGIVNGHPSVLPRWRGPNPFGWTIRAGDTEAGYTWHVMDEDFDTGAILAQGSMPISDDDTIATILQRYPALTQPLFERALARIEAGDRGDPQPAEGATYAPTFEDEWAEIDWTQPARDALRQIRSWFTPSVSGILGPLTTLDGERVRVLEAEPADAEGAPGTIVARDGGARVVACGAGAVRVMRTEPA